MAYNRDVTNRMEAILFRYAIEVLSGNGGTLVTGLQKKRMNNQIRKTKKSVKGFNKV